MLPITNVRTSVGFFTARNMFLYGLPWCCNQVYCEQSNQVFSCKSKTISIINWKECCSHILFNIHAILPSINLRVAMCITQMMISSHVVDVILWTVRAQARIR